MIVSGGAGSGKTTLLGVLSEFIPDGERLITIEDAAELRLAKPHVVALEARPALRLSWTLATSDHEIPFHNS